MNCEWAWMKWRRKIKRMCIYYDYHTLSTPICLEIDFLFYFMQQQQKADYVPPLPLPKNRKLHEACCRQSIWTLNVLLLPYQLKCWCRFSLYTISFSPHMTFKAKHRHILEIIFLASYFVSKNVFFSYYFLCNPYEAFSVYILST